MSDKSAHVPVLTPPGQGGGPVADEAGRYRLLWIALAAVLLLGLAVILVLPRLIDTAPQAVAPVADPAVVPAPSATASREAANQAMSSYLQLRAQLELQHADRWGEPQWSQAEQAADQGARLLAQRRFGTAAGDYEQAAQALQQLGSERETRLATALAAGRQALDGNQLESAVEQFERVLAIDADNADARFGLARARTRPALLEHMTRGEQAEANGDLLAAQAAYQEAALLDPEYEPPAVAFNRVTTGLEAVAFQDAMTRALTALDKGRLGDAQKALKEASAHRPSDPAVIDARQTLDRLRKIARMKGLRRQAEAQVKAENWQAAVNTYKKALAMDASAGFARDGLDKAGSRLKLNRQFDHYLQKPERLYAAGPLENARTLLAAVSSVPADEPKLASKVTRLQHLVEAAGTPVTVSLRSDGVTDVSVYHVGQLGAFTEQQLELLPGTYTVVGSCPGYRDVRKQLRVKPGKQAVSLMVRCEEPI